MMIIVIMMYLEQIIMIPQKIIICDHDASQAHDYDDNYEPVDPYILDYDDYDDN